MRYLLIIRQFNFLTLTFKQVCGECGKGFYRKDHLRKHANSHAAKRLKEEINARAASLLTPIPSTFFTNTIEEKADKNLEKDSNILFATNSNMLFSHGDENTNIESNSSVQITNTQAAISLSTLYVSNYRK